MRPNAQDKRRIVTNVLKAGSRNGYNLTAISAACSNALWNLQRWRTAQRASCRLTIQR